MKHLKKRLSLLFLTTLFLASCQPLIGSFSITSDPVTLINRRAEQVQLDLEASYQATVHVHPRQGKVTLETRTGRKKQLFDFGNAFTPSEYEDFDFYVDARASGQPYDLGWTMREVERETGSKEAYQSCSLGHTETCRWEYDQDGNRRYRCRTIEVMGHQHVRITTFEDITFIRGHLFEPGTNEEAARFQLSQVGGKHNSTQPLSDCTLRP